MVEYNSWIACVSNRLGGGSFLSINHTVPEAALKGIVWNF